MFFYLSKIFLFFIQPLNLGIFLILAGILATLLRRQRPPLLPCLRSSSSVSRHGRRWARLYWARSEERFPRPEQPAEVAGIVVLGGSFHGAINLARGGYELNSGGDRFVETAVLARRYPQAKVVVSGGSGSLGEADADTAPRLLEALGVARERLILENRSRNTDENALFTKGLVSPKPAETWLLVTSVSMPRAVGFSERPDLRSCLGPWITAPPGEEGFGLMRDGPVNCCS